MMYQVTPPDAAGHPAVFGPSEYLVGPASRYLPKQTAPVNSPLGCDVMLRE
jgi:hypothetical protein